MHRSRLAGLIIDCNTDDLDAAADFWGKALGAPAASVADMEQSPYVDLQMPEDENYVEIQAVAFRFHVHWREMNTYSLVDGSGEMLAFGQFYERHGRINLARLVVSPDRRRQGIGKQLVNRLMDQGRKEIRRQEYSLYVY